MSHPCPNCGCREFQVDASRVTICTRCGISFFVPGLRPEIPVKKARALGVEFWVLGVVLLMTVYVWHTVIR